MDLHQQLVVGVNEALMPLLPAQFEWSHLFL